MATIVSTLFIALDGVAEVDPAWHFPYFDDRMGAGVGGDYEDVGTALVAGSLSVVRQLLDAGLLDELRLYVHPVAAGSGERLWDDGPVRPLRLVSSEAYPTGVLRLVYGPSELPGTAGYDDARTHLPES